MSLLKERHENLVSFSIIPIFLLMWYHNFHMVNVMLDNNSLSESTEMYLITIHKIHECCNNMPIPIPQIAEALIVQPVSANQMIKKLADDGLVKYTPYKGVELTTEGTRITNRILRYRRLWQIFLTEVLGIDFDSADAIACRVEHITSNEVANRMADFLGNPQFNKLGFPIPQIDSIEIQPFQGIPLTKMNVGQSFTVLQVNANETTANFLSHEGIGPSLKAELLAIGSQSDLMLKTQSGRVNLSSDIAAEIIVEPSVDSMNLQSAYHAP